MAPRRFSIATLLLIGFLAITTGVARLCTWLFIAAALTGPRPGIATLLALFAFIASKVAYRLFDIYRQTLIA